jgi:hypothetical protein
MLMLALTSGGRERTAAHYDTLWDRAGLQCVKRNTLPSAGTLFELRPR